jgi:hypothetical protein
VTVDGFLPVAVIIGGILVGGSLIYAVFYGFHMRVIGSYGAWWAWPLLTLYAVCGAISFACAALEWHGSPDQYGFYGDYDKARRIWSFVLLGVLSILLLVSARHAASAAKSAKPKG